MSYCRFANGDAYVFRNLHGELECCACRLTPAGEWFGTYTTEDPASMLKHLERHKQAGHRIPQAAIERLRSESA